MEYVVGCALGLGLLAVGFLLGWTFQIQRPPRPNGDASTLVLFKQIAEKALSEAGATRTFADGIVGDLLKSNGQLADKVLTIADGTLERMRIERLDPIPGKRRIPSPFDEPSPVVDEPSTITIPDRTSEMNDPHG